MSRFNYCYKLIFNSDVSHAWIHLHRCVEMLAKTKGESFSSIFMRIEKKFKFDRSNIAKFPDLETIKKIVISLKDERDDFLRELNELVLERKAEKRTGKRISSNKDFLDIIHKQAMYNPQKKDCFYWRKQRQINK